MSLSLLCRCLFVSHSLIPLSTCFLCALSVCNRFSGKGVHNLVVNAQCVRVRGYAAHPGGLHAPRDYFCRAVPTPCCTRYNTEVRTVVLVLLWPFAVCDVADVTVVTHGGLQ